MEIFQTCKKIPFIITPLIVTIFASATQAANIPSVPTNWHAKPPIHLRSRTATASPQGVIPSQMSKAYGFSLTNQGKGQVIAIVDSYDNPNIEKDLGVFSKKFGLPECTTDNGCFTKIYSSGTKPPGDEDWGVEEALDVQWAHAMAPLAKIILVEAPDASNNLFSAIDVAIKHNASVISLSWGGDEFDGETAFDSYFKNSPVPIVVSSGDSGSGVEYPASSPYVLSVGGTELSLDSKGNYVSETAWDGSGGGISAYEKEPSYQTNFPIPKDGKGRGVPDVSYDASPSSGVAIYDTYGQNGWLEVGGTSAGAPQWAALIADINSARTSNITSANSLLYTAALKSSADLYHDITTGENGSCGYYCTARSGYDYVTGFGSPKAGSLITYFKKQEQQ